MPENQTYFAWQGHEHTHKERSTDWFWALGIIAVSSAVVAAIFENLLFAVLILLAAFMLAMFAAKQPALHMFRIDSRGIAIDKTLYPYGVFDAFWIDSQEELDGGNGHNTQLLLKPNQGLASLFILPLHATIDPKALRDYLRERIEEEELHEALSQKLVELAGF